MSFTSPVLKGDVTLHVMGRTSGFRCYTGPSGLGRPCSRSSFPSSQELCDGETAPLRKDVGQYTECFHVCHSLSECRARAGPFVTGVTDTGTATSPAPSYCNVLILSRVSATRSTFHLENSPLNVLLTHSGLRSGVRPKDCSLYSSPRVRPTTCLTFFRAAVDAAPRAGPGTPRVLKEGGMNGRRTARGARRHGGALMRAGSQAGAATGTGSEGPARGRS